MPQDDWSRSPQDASRVRKARPEPPVLQGPQWLIRVRKVTTEPQPQERLVLKVHKVSKVRKVRPEPQDANGDAVDDGCYFNFGASRVRRVHKVHRVIRVPRVILEPQEPSR